MTTYIMSLKQEAGENIHTMTYWRACQAGALHAVDGGHLGFAQVLHPVCRMMCTLLLTCQTHAHLELASLKPSPACPETGNQCALC